MSTITKFEDSVAREYARAHRPECGKPMSRRQLRLISGQLKKKYSDSEGSKGDDLTEMILRQLLYLDTLPTPVAQLAACKWLCSGAIRLPDEETIVLQAVKVAKLNHVDPIGYDSPEAIILSFRPLCRPAGPINPDTVSTLHINRRYHSGLAIYDVEDTIESQVNLREIINTHLGYTANPWCLLEGCGCGGLTEMALDYWDDYSAYPKQVAFINGKLVAFSAEHPFSYTGERIWWNRQNKVVKSISRLKKRIPGDKLGRCSSFRISLSDGKMTRCGRIFKGTKEHGWYEEYHSLKDTKPTERGFYWKGKKLFSEYVSGFSEEQLAEILSISDIKKGIIRIPDSIKTIPSNAFIGNTLIKEVYLHNGVTHILAGAFAGCSNLRAIEIPNSVKCIGSGAFVGCSSLITARLPEKLTVLQLDLFKNCTSLSEISLPSSLMTIEQNAFYGCSSLERIVFPEYLRWIEKSAFSSCRSLSEIKFPNCLEKIGLGAFSGCDSLQEVTIPSSVTSVQPGSFSMCWNISHFLVPSRWYSMFHGRYGNRVYKTCA